MTEMEKMWAEMAKHQPIADRRGYGTQWQCMCGLKTEEAAKAARDAAWSAKAAGWAAWSAKAAAQAVKAAQAAAAGWAAHARWDASEAIRNIKIANMEMP